VLRSLPGVQRSAFGLLRQHLRASVVLVQNLRAQRGDGAKLKGQQGSLVLELVPGAHSLLRVAGAALCVSSCGPAWRAGFTLGWYVAVDMAGVHAQWLLETVSVVAGNGTRRKFWGNF